MEQNIKNRIESLRHEFTHLSGKGDDYVFNGVVAQSIFYKQPSNQLDNIEIEKIIVDGTRDGGIDCILNDKESDFQDLVFIQCKYYDSIAFENIKDALSKMYAAYRLLKEEKYSNFKDSLVEQYQNCLSEMEDGAITKFVFCTSALRGGIKNSQIKNYFKSIIQDEKIELEIYFEKEISEKIIEFDSLRRTVSFGKLEMDKTGNVLKFKEVNDDKAIVFNGSANSIKELYAKNHLALFAQNLRYFVASKNIDNDINKSITKSKDKFWYKNNGITILCDSFDISGKEVKLENFSIVNGGQTTTLIGKNDSINKDNDFYLPIKVIKTQGNSDEEKQNFIFEIARATNSQKAIKPIDLKANEPEQILFSKEMRKNEIFYRTKRGEIMICTPNPRH